MINQVRWNKLDERYSTFSNYRGKELKKKKKKNNKKVCYIIKSYIRKSQGYKIYT